MNSIYPLNITLEGKPLTIIGTDGNSYVAEDGRTWLIPESGEGTDADTIQAHILAELAKPGEEAMPWTITPRQLFATVYQLHGITPEAIAAKIEAIPDDGTRTIAKIELERATHFNRDHALLGQLASIFGLTSEQVDDIFREAPKLFP